MISYFVYITFREALLVVNTSCHVYHSYLLFFHRWTFFLRLRWQFSLFIDSFAWIYYNNMMVWYLTFQRLIQAFVMSINWWKFSEILRWNGYLLRLTNIVCCLRHLLRSLYAVCTLFLFICFEWISVPANCVLYGRKCCVTHLYVISNLHEVHRKNLFYDSWYVLN